MALWDILPDVLGDDFFPDTFTVQEEAATAAGTAGRDPYSGSRRASGDSKWVTKKRAADNSEMTGVRGAVFYNRENAPPMIGGGNETVAVPLIILKRFEPDIAAKDRLRNEATGEQFNVLFAGDDAQHVSSYLDVSVLPGVA